MHLAVLGATDSWYLADLQRAAAADHTIVPLPFTRLAATLGSAVDFRSGPVSLAAFDAVLVRAMPPGSLEQVIFRMDVLQRLQAAGIPVVNPPRALECAIDKYLSLARLADAGLAVPATECCQSVDEALGAFQRLGRDVVVKPLFGSEGRGMLRVQDESLAGRVFKALVQIGAVLYVQEFIEHPGYDLRLLVLGSTVLGIRRCHPDDWRTNLSRGAWAEPLVVDDSLHCLARRAADAIGAPLAGVDVLPACDGRRFVLEVNAVPGWKGLAQALRQDVAAIVLRCVGRIAQGL